MCASLGENYRIFLWQIINYIYNLMISYLSSSVWFKKIMWLFFIKQSIKGTTLFKIYISFQVTSTKYLNLNKKITSYNLNKKMLTTSYKKLLLSEL